LLAKYMSWVFYDNHCRAI